MPTCTSLAIALLIAAAPAAQGGAAPPHKPTGSQAHTTAPPAIRTASAARISRGVIATDGALDETPWQSVAPLADFLQKDPVEGGTPTDGVEVRFLYDDDALYIGVRVRSADAAGIQAPVSRRDNVSQAEYVLVSLDTYHDRRTAYSFGVTASGVRADWYHRNDSESATDASFDPVWEAAVRRDGTGWTAEMRIAFSQLRFHGAAAQTWGVNVVHWISSRNESDYWVLVPKRDVGWSSRMGELGGLTGLRPARRAELLPYVASNATVTPADTRRGNPFDDGSTVRPRAGGDLKLGLGPSLTLQATVNPDFGQVEADPAVVNLSAFETFFPERRPFFTEGSQLFDLGGLSYFYSRRVGRRPTLPVEATFVDYPEASTILGAAKLTGRVSARTAVGALAALTDREYARTFEPDATPGGVRERPVVAPRTGYGVASVQREFGPSGSTAGVIATAVERNLDGGSLLAARLNRRAYAAGSEFNVRLKGGAYTLSGTLGGSYVEGDSAQILRLQRSSARYFQRPDAAVDRLDSSRTSLAGYNASLGARKEAGTHWLWGVNGGVASPGFEINDAGFYAQADQIYNSAYLHYRETQPGRRLLVPLRSWSLRLGEETEWNTARVRSFGSWILEGNATFVNFWTLAVTGWHDWRSQSMRLTRGGPYMGTPGNNTIIVRLGSSTAARTSWWGRVYYAKDDYGGPTNRLSAGFSARPTPGLFLSAEPNFLRYVDSQQYVTTLDGGLAATYRRRYVFSRLDASEFAFVARVNYTMTPDLTLELYARPYSWAGRFARFGELDAPRSRSLREYGTDATTIVRDADAGEYVVTDGRTIDAQGDPARFTIPFQDFSTRSLRSNFVLRWEYRPGSTLFFIWQQDRGYDDASGRIVSFDDLLGWRRVAGRNVLAVKASYWLAL